MHSAFTVLLLAAPPMTVADRIRSVPTQSWINLGICLLALILVIRLWRALKKFNEFAPWIVGALAGSFILFYWVYERSEPAFLTPIVEKLTFFMPTKSRQQEQVDKIKKNHDAVHP